MPTLVATNSTSFLPGISLNLPSRTWATPFVTSSEVPEGISMLMLTCAGWVFGKNSTPLLNRAKRIMIKSRIPNAPPIVSHFLSSVHRSNFTYPFWSKGKKTLSTS